MAASAAALRRELEAAKLTETIEAINKLVETLTAQAEALDLRRFGPLAEEASQAIAEFRGTVKGLDSALKGPIADAQRLMAKVNTEIDNLPIEASREALASVEEAVREATGKLEASAESFFKETLASIRQTSRMAMAALAIAGLCGLGGLVRLLRRRKA